MSRTIMTALAITLFGVACAGLPGAQEGGRAPQPEPDSILVNAVNENYYDARIHAVYVGGQRRSLGTIAANGGRTRMALAWEPRALVFEVLFVTDGATYVSHSVDVAPGESIEIRVPANISASGFFRRVPRS